MRELLPGLKEYDDRLAKWDKSTVGLVALAVGVNLFVSHHNALRADITSENLNSLSPRTVRLVKELQHDDKVKTIKVVRELTGQGLGEAKATVEGAPKAIKENVDKKTAEEVKKKLEESGAKVSIK